MHKIPIGQHHIEWITQRLQRGDLGKTNWTKCPTIKTLKKKKKKILGLKV